MIETILIADDEPLARARVAGLARRHAPAATIHEAGDGAAAVSLIHATRPDALFLDVDMPELDGLGVLASVGCAAMPPTVFVTAYDEHALAAFDAAAVDYLLKPFDDARFDLAWARLVQRRAAGAAVAEAQRLAALLDALAQGPRGAAAGAHDRLVLREAGRTVVVPLADVLWVESSGNHVVLHGDGRTWRVRETLARIEARLDPARFVRIHRRFVVDVSAMRELRPWSGGDQLLVLRDGAKLPVSRNYRHALAARLEGRA